MLNQLLASRPDLKETLLKNADLTLFIVGSYLKDETGTYKAGYVIVSLIENTEAGSLPMAVLAQQAELTT